MPPKHGTKVSATVCPVDEIIDATISRHADDARTRKEGEERARLGPRRRIAKRVLALIRTERRHVKSNGVHLGEKQLAQLSEEVGKLIAKRLGLEPNNKKE